MELFESFKLPSSAGLETFSKTSLLETLKKNHPHVDTVMRNYSEKIIGRAFSGSEIINSRNHIMLNGSHYTTDDWIQQVEYDKFMNEVWVGIVLTLIVISMVFCVCSCFLYHQFQQWKRNYQQSVRRSLDIESIKLNMDDDDSLPSYTLVSGLPSYDAALEQLQKSPDNTYVVRPPIFHVFNCNEKEDSITGLPSIVSPMITQEQQHQNQNSSTVKQTEVKPKETEVHLKVPSYEEALLEQRS